MNPTTCPRCGADAKPVVNRDEYVCVRPCGWSITGIEIHRQQKQ